MLCTGRFILVESVSLSSFTGHTFLLIWNNLFILEEGKAYLGWERIKDMLRNEEHKRLSVDLSPGGDAPDSTSLSRLKNEEFLHLRSNYKTYTPWVRLLFCLLAFMVTLWDWMLFCTVLYFHITLEKMIASALAILTWYLLYRVVYNQSWSPGLPGDGMFKYVKDTRFMRRESLKRTSELSSKTWTNRDDVPKFMGMPIYTPKPQKEELLEDDFTRNVRNARKASMDASVSTYNLRSRSRSASRTRMNSVSRSSLNSKLWWSSIWKIFKLIGYLVYTIKFVLIDERLVNLAIFQSFSILKCHKGHVCEFALMKISMDPFLTPKYQTQVLISKSVWSHWYFIIRL